MVLLLHVRERVRRVHGKRELKIGLPVFEGLHERREPLGPNGPSEYLDEEPLLEECVTDVCALLDVASGLPSQFLQPTFENSTIQPDVDSALNAFQPGRRQVTMVEDAAIDGLTGP